MQLDPFIHLQIQDQEIQRQVKQNALVREAREARRNSTESAGSLGGRYRVASRPLEVASLLGALALIAGATGFTRFGG